MSNNINITLFLLCICTGSDFELAINQTGVNIITVEFQPMDQTITGTVFITEDSIFEQDEEIRFQLSLPTGSPAELGSVRTTTVTIEDNEGMHTLDQGLYFVSGVVYQARLSLTLTFLEVRDGLA